MIILVLGPNGSGKSVYAERLTAGMSETRCYIATMKPYGAEGAARVARHLRQRSGLGFCTLELPYTVGGAPLAPGTAVLLEDVSNLLANVLFERRGGPEDVLADILRLCKRVKHTVMVSISPLAEGDYSPETRWYMGQLDRLNGQLRDAADMVVEMREGTPVVVKGDGDGLDAGGAAGGCDLFADTPAEGPVGG